MKILCLSDLHRNSNYDYQQNEWIKSLLKESKPDVVVITGDIFEASYQGNPYKGLAKLFGDITVICTLGNHEFVDLTVPFVIDKYRGKYKPDKYNVHYLDIVGKYDVTIDNISVRFTGNVLWYDGSMSTVENQTVSDFADGNWLDRRIVEFDYKKECENCINQIKENLSNEEDVINILCTHCVPHFKLNGHLHKKSSLFNAYSGIYNLLERDGIKGKLTYCVCGHTHLRIIGDEVEDTWGINCGNDYHPPFQSFLLEL